MQLTAEQKQIGQDNFHEAVGSTRRDFLKGIAMGGAGLGAAYFGYSKLTGNPVKVAFIGTGDEGSVLLNEHPPEYMDIVAIADLRPSNRVRSIKGDGNDNRRGLAKVLGADKAKSIKQYDSHKKLLEARAAKEVEFDAVVIAVPLCQHAAVAIDCMKEGLHVLTEKLMAHNITECKSMIKTARDKNVLLAVGHQRHYNVLYDNANDLVQKGLLGTIKHIRAQWHRNNSYPGKDSWRKENGSTARAYKSDQEALSDELCQQFGYDSYDKLANWRLYNETGGGLMAELGSHQLDACSIFLGKVKPISVTGYGGKNYYGVTWKDKDGNQRGVGPSDKWNDPREIDDHVYTIYEFPGPHYDDDPHDVVIVTYSSLNTNASEPYGELVYGSRATLIMEKEQKTILIPEKGGAEQRLKVVEGKGGPVIDASDSLAPTAAAAAANVGEKVSRGYTEEMEHFAWCIENHGPNYYPDGKPVPRADKGLRCPDVQGMADAIMALTANLSMKHRKRIEFKPEWFDPDQMEAVPETDPDVVGG